MNPPLLELYQISQEAHALQVIFALLQFSAQTHGGSVLSRLKNSCLQMEVQYFEGKSQGYSGKKNVFRVVRVHLHCDRGSFAVLSQNSERYHLFVNHITRWMYR